LQKSIFVRSHDMNNSNKR